MSKVIFRSGMIMLLFLAFLMTFSAVGLQAGITPSALTFFLSAVAAIASSCLLSERGEGWKRETVAAAVLAAAVFVACCAVAGQFRDLTVDGNAYHKLAVAALQDGWNPLRGPVTDWLRYDEIYTFETRAPLWVEHYAQGLWFVSAAVYDVVGSIEAAKSYTLLAMFAFAALCQRYLVSKGFRPWQAALVAVLGAVNPITLVQFNTYYCDAFLMMALFSLILGLVMLADEASAPDRKAVLAIIAASFILAANTKFTGLAYAGVFSVSFCVLYLYRWRHGSRGFSGKETAGLAVFFVGLVLFSVVVVGFSSYVTNFLDHGNPLYPLFGEGKVDIMTPQEPDAFQDASTLKKLFYSYFSQTANLTPGTGDPVLKLPFTVSAEELSWLSAVDLRIGGFGVLYSGILLVCVAMFAAMLAWSRKHCRLLFETGLAFVVPMACLTFGLADSWWARYSTYVYAANLFVLAFAFSAVRKLPSGGVRVLLAAAGGIFAALLAANTALFLVFGVTENWHASQNLAEKEAYVVDQVKEEGATLYLSYDWMPGEVYSLDDAGVDYVNESGREQGTYQEGDTLDVLRYRLEYSDAAPAINDVPAREE